MRTVASVLLSFLLVSITHFSFAEIIVPRLWDDRQHLSKPDLSALVRLRFLTTTDFFPFNFIDSQRRLSGFHVDLARAICRVLEIEERCQIQALPFEELENALREGKGEALIAGLAITAERREDFIFTRSYLHFPGRFVFSRDAELSQPMSEEVADKRIGVVSDTAHEQMLRDLFPKAEPVTYSQPEPMMNDLKKGKIDGVFGDGMRLSFWLAGKESQNCCAFAGGPYLAPEYLGHGLAIAVPRSAPELAQALNYALQEIEASGTLDEFYLRYFPVSFY